VEAVDDCFVDKHFGSHNHPFFKGNPESLQYPFGQNANLAYTHGNDSSGYMLYYKMESEYGWTQLFDFINNVISSPRLKGVKLWWWFGDIKFVKEGQTKSGEMSNVISFVDGVIKTDNGESIDLN